MNEVEHDDDFDDMLTSEERKQLDSALQMDNLEGFGEDDDRGDADCRENGAGIAPGKGESNGNVTAKKSWLGWNNKNSKSAGDDSEDPKIPRKFSKLEKDDVSDAKKEKDKSLKKQKKKGYSSDSKLESEYKKGLRPVLWLTADFPLKTEELLPVLDILANKVKAIRRLRELLTTKLPSGTFPVKVTIPIVPTVRVVVTFTKFEELPPTEEFSTPLSSPAHFQDSKSKDSENSSSSWISWMRGNREGQSSDHESQSHRYRDDIDPFTIPSDYTWVDANEKKRRGKAKRAKSKKTRKPTSRENGKIDLE